MKVVSLLLVLLVLLVLVFDCNSLVNSNGSQSEKPPTTPEKPPTKPENPLTTPEKPPTTSEKPPTTPETPEESACLSPQNETEIDCIVVANNNNNNRSNVPGGRDVEKEKEKVWFRFEVQDLINRKILFNWPSIRKRPILKEYMYFGRNYLNRMNWIEKRFTADVGEQYFAKNDVAPLKAFTGFDEDSGPDQLLYFDAILLHPNEKFMKDFLRGPKNKNDSIMLEAFKFFNPIRLNSFPYKTYTSSPTYHFRSYMFREKGMHEALVNGTFAEFAKLNYNELPNNLSSVRIWVGRAIEDWHWQKKEETSIFQYETHEIIKTGSLLNKIPWYLDCYTYIEHIGRFKRFPENAWLMFLNFKQEDGKYIRPYRVINPEAYQQEEFDFYAVPKEKLGEFFKLDKDDTEYMAIFGKVEEEKQDADTVWMSDVLLDYIKFMNPTNKDLGDFKTKLKKKGYDDMVKQMCAVDKSKLTRMITLHIVQDYSIFTDGQPMYQYSFSSQLILRWTCYSLNEEGCMDKTFSIVCRYMMKNHPAKNRATERHPKWPLPEKQVVRTEATIASFEPKITDIITVETSKNRFSADSYPNAKFVYSPANRPLLGRLYQRIVLLISLVLLIKNLTNL